MSLTDNAELPVATSDVPAVPAEPPVPPEPDEVAAVKLRPARVRRTVGFLQRHLAMIVVLVLGATLRVLTVVTYWPAMWLSDSTQYFDTARTGVPSQIRPYGYSAFVWLFSGFDNTGVVVVAQHVLGLGLAVGIYTLVRRRGGSWWLATLAAVPISLDAFQIIVEQYLLADVLFTVVLFGGLACLLWNERLSTPMAVCAGLLLSGAALTRSVGLPVAVLSILYPILRGAGWRPVVGMFLAVAAPMAGYLQWYQSNHGVEAFGQWQGRFLYARVMTIADCNKLVLPGEEYVLCDARDPAHRPAVDFYIWNHRSPARHFPSVEDDPILQDFASSVIAQQSEEYVRLVIGETVYYFLPGRQIPSGGTLVSQWTFPTSDTVARKMPYLVADTDFTVDRGPKRMSLPRTADLLAAYQNHGGYTPGPLLGACVLLALAAFVLRPFRGGWRRRLDSLWLAGIGVGLLATAVATSQFDYRYGLPALMLLPIAGALGATQLAAAFRAPQVSIRARQPSAQDPISVERM